MHILREGNKVSELKRLQIYFSDAVGDLLAWCKMNEIYVRYGETYRSPEEAERLYKKGVGARISAHTNRLAVDFIFCRIEVSEDIIDCERNVYEKAGLFWKSLNCVARWGGDFKNAKYDDIYHFSFEYKGVK